MPQIYKKLLPFIVSFCFFSANAQTNKGTEFWVGYGHHQYMEPSSCGVTAGPNDMNMRIYLSNTETTTATVTVTLDSSGIATTPATWYKRTYTIAPNTVIETENMPKGVVNAALSGTDVNYDARLWSEAPPASTGSEGLFRKKGIHIESNVPIVAYAHTYGGVASGATMLLPVESWGDNYATINSEQGGGVTGCFSWMYVIAKEDNTIVEITPSQPSRIGKPAGVAFQVTLHKGQIYQLIGNADCITGAGVQLTGTKVRSLSAGKTIAVFAGSSRTGGEASSCGASGRDNDIQQCFPKSAWGKKYLTAPASKSNGSSNLLASSFQTNVYKILVNDPTTVVTKNGVTLNSLVNSSYYQYTSNTADYIEADKPVMVAMFMSNGSVCGSGDGDPEMTYLSPMEQGGKKAAFYRTNLQAINSNYVTLVVPTVGVSSLTIDGSSTFSHTYVHPRLAGYTVVIKGWAAAKAQCNISCDTTFTGYTYGMGGAESYGYNLGANFATINTVVPLSLLDFSASKMQNDVLVNWKSANEINFDHFDIERSLNGTDFIKAGTVSSKQNAGLYSFTDKNAAKSFASARILYYRLKMVDKDGSFTYSKVAAVKLDKNLNNQISVYPNPFVNEIKIRINTENAGLANISIKDISGRLIESKSTFIPQGSNLVNLENLAKLNKGVYILSVEINGNYGYYKLTK